MYCVTVVALLFFADAWAPAVGRWLDAGVAPVAADAVLPLPGGEETRPFVAAALHKAGLAERVLILQNPELPTEADGLQPRTHQIIEQVLVLRGVPADKLELIDGASVSTQDDAALTARYVKSLPPERRVDRLLVVTNDYHTRRTGWLFQRAFQDQPIQLTIVSAPQNSFPLERWWENAAGVTAVTSEYVKLFSYWLLHAGGWWQLGAVLLVLVLWKLVHGGRRE